MKRFPGISVIIPVRDYGLFISEAIESVLNQTLQPSEIIVIDDGSEDNTREMVKKYAPDVSCFYLDKKGVGAARNFGIEQSTGEFISHLDADDFWDMKKLEIQMEAFDEDPELEIAGALMQPFYDPDMDPEKKMRIYCSEQPIPGFSPSVLLLKRLSFKKVGLYRNDLKTGQDLEWFIRAREIPLKEKMVTGVLAYRRLHNSNSSISDRSAREDRLKVLKESLDRRRKKS